MLGKLRPLCLAKYVHYACTQQWLRGADITIRRLYGAISCSFYVDIRGYKEYNYKDILSSTFPGAWDGIGPFTSTYASSASFERTGCHPPAPSGGDRSIVPRQRRTISYR